MNLQFNNYLFCFLKDTLLPCRISGCASPATGVWPREGCSSQQNKSTSIHLPKLWECWAEAAEPDSQADKCIQLPLLPHHTLIPAVGTTLFSAAVMGSDSGLWFVKKSRWHSTAAKGCQKNLLLGWLFFSHSLARVLLLELRICRQGPREGNTRRGMAGGRGCFSLSFEPN